MAAEQPIQEVPQTQETVTPVEEVKEEAKPLNNWNDLIVESTNTTNVETKVVQTDFYKKKYNESDWVLMFHNPERIIETWIVKDLLEGVDVKARGIRQGKTGKCYADFDDEETWKKVKALSGQFIDDIQIFVDDVPPRTEAPKARFNKGKKFDGEKKPQGKYANKVSKYPKKEGEFEKKEKKDDYHHPFKGKKTTKKMVTFDPNMKKTGHAQKEKTPKEEEEKKVKKAKKVVKEVELTQEEIDEGWSDVKKGAQVGGKKKKSGKQHIEGILDRKNMFE